MLIEEPLTLSTRPISELAADFVREGKKRFASVNCFDFVPSDYAHVWRVLDGLPRGVFCEWGSGMGIVTGLAEILGFSAQGIEIDSQLAASSRDLLSKFGLESTILTGNYLELSCDADMYYVYCWPGQMNNVQRHFISATQSDARLLICHGASDVRLKRKPVREDPNTDLDHSK